MLDRLLIAFSTWGDVLLYINEVPFNGEPVTKLQVSAKGGVGGDDGGNGGIDGGS